MILRPASELNPPSVDWLWLNYLALGNIAILDGDPGLGKSLLTLDLCARLTTGRPFPDGAPGSAPASVIVLCVEDGERVVIPRLRALGADLTRVFPWPRYEEPGLPVFPHDIQRLDDAIAETGAKLIIIDPIVAFLDNSVNLADDRSVRRALAALQRLAEKHNCVIVLVRHLNKHANDHPLYRGGGSIAFVAACRLAWLAGRAPRVDDRVFLAQQKNNYAPLQPTLAYRLPADGPRIDWLGTSPHLAIDLSGKPRPRPRREKARQLLLTLLKDGPRTSDDIWQAVQEHAYAPPTVRRAKKELKIHCETVKENDRPVTYWLLERQELPEHLLDPNDAVVRAHLRRIEAQCPPRNPLDDDQDAAARAEILWREHRDAERQAREAEREAAKALTPAERLEARRQADLEEQRECERDAAAMVEILRRQQREAG